MTGASVDHNAIVSNINRELSIQFKGRPCQVYASGMKVLIRSGNAGTRTWLRSAVSKSCWTVAAMSCSTPP